MSHLDRDVAGCRPHQTPAGSDDDGRPSQKRSGHVTYLPRSDKARAARVARQATGWVIVPRDVIVALHEEQSGQRFAGARRLSNPGGESGG